jgi:hypothetical protein
MNIGSTAGSSFSIATAGIQQSNEQLKQASQQVVEATTPRPVQGTVEVTDALVNLTKSEESIEVNAKVLEAADNQLGSLLDVKV